MGLFLYGSQLSFTDPAACFTASSVFYAVTIISTVHFFLILVTPIVYYDVIFKAVRAFTSQMYSTLSLLGLMWAVGLECTQYTPAVVVGHYLDLCR